MVVHTGYCTRLVRSLSELEFGATSDSRESKQGLTDETLGQLRRATGRGLYRLKTFVAVVGVVTGDGVTTVFAAITALIALGSFNTTETLSRATELSTRTWTVVEGDLNRPVEFRADDEFGARQPDAGTPEAQPAD